MQFHYNKKSRLTPDGDSISLSYPNLNKSVILGLGIVPFILGIKQLKSIIICGQYLTYAPN